MTKTALRIIAAATVLLLLFPATAAGASGGVTDTAGETTATDPQEEPVFRSIDYFAPGFVLSDYVSVGEYKGMSITCNVRPDESEVEQYIARFAKAMNCYSELKDRTTASGDTLNISYTGKINGEIADASESAMIELTNSNGFVPGFDVGLYGVSPGATVGNTVTYPGIYEKKELAGKTVSYEITVNFIYDYRFTSDLDVWKSTNGGFSTLAGFTAYVRDALTEQNLTEYDTLLSQAVSDALMIRATLTGISLPEAQILFYISYLKSINKDYEAYDDAVLRVYAELAINEDLVLASVYLAENGSFDDEKYAEALKQSASENGVTEKFIENAYGGADYCRIALMKKQAIASVLSSVTVMTDKDEYAYLLDDNTTTAGVDTTTAPEVTTTDDGGQPDPNLIMVMIVLAAAATACAAAVVIYLIKRRRSAENKE